MTVALESVRWIHGAPDCAENTDPLLQVHRYNRDTFIMRENKCLNYEGNFLYLLFGEARVILFDTGAGPESRAHGKILPLRSTVDRIIEDWESERGSAGLDMIVAHTHSHGDHVFWDGQFQGRARTTIVGRALSERQSVLPPAGLAGGRGSVGARRQVLDDLPAAGTRGRPYRRL